MAAGHVTVDGVSGVTTPDKAALDIDGLSGLTMVMLVAADDWTPVGDQWIFAKDAGSSQRSYATLLKPDGSLQLPTSSDGSTRQFPSSSSVSGLVSDGDHLWLRMFYETDGTNYTTTYEYSLDPIDTPVGPVTWSSIGSDDSGLFGSLFNSTAPLAFGNRDTGTTPLGFVGKLYAAWLYDGTQATGTLVANPDFREAAPGADGLGNTWTLVGNAAWTPPTGRFTGRHVHYDFLNKRVVIESGV